MSVPLPKLPMTAVSIYMVLMAENQWIASSELAATLGIQKLPSDALKLLKQAELIEVGKVGRGNTYRISKIGWARCLDVMALPVLVRGSAPRAMLTLLQGLHRGFSNRPDLDPQMFFIPSDEVETPPITAAETNVRPVQLTESETLVREAYAQLSRMPGDWVPLAELRKHLRLARGDADAALESLAMQSGVQLIPWDNRKALTADDRAAALHFGGDDNHALRIEAV